MASVSGEDGGRWILATLPTRGAARLEGLSGLGGSTAGPTVSLLRPPAAHCQTRPQTQALRPTPLSR